LFEAQPDNTFLTH